MDSNKDGYDINGREDPEVLPLEDPPFNPKSTARHGSLPLIVVGDHNANLEPNLNDKLGLPLMPRREGTVTLPPRYQARLDRHKQNAKLMGSKSNSWTGIPGKRDIYGMSKPGNTSASVSESNLNVKPANETLDGGHQSGLSYRLGYTSESVVNRDVNAPTEGTAEISDRLSDRLGDLDTALKWIKQEMIEIKQADRFLMRRLLDLRAHLHQIQGLPNHLSLSSNLAQLGSCGSDLDVATWSSFLSLDEDALMDPSSDYTARVKDMLQSLQHQEPAPRGCASGSVPVLTNLSRSVSSRSPMKPPTRIKRKKSLPMANELEEDHFFDDDD